jgi:hypothetical protein
MTNGERQVNVDRGAAMLVLQTFVRGQTIRAPLRQPHAP